MKRRYMAPLIILAILLLLMVFRWDVQATKSYTWSVAKWKQDRWTGEVWICKYDPYGAAKIPTRYEESNIHKITTLLTLAWWVLFVGDAIWLLVAVLRGKEKHEEYN